MSVVARIAVALVMLAGCGGGRPDPWGRRLTEDERVAWGRSCGPRYSHSFDPNTPLRYGSDTEDYSYQSASYRSDPSAKAFSECSLTWDLTHDRMLRIGVRFTRLQVTPLSADQIEPYIRLIEQLLPADEQRIARKVASGPEQRVKTKNFEIRGGYSTITGAAWDLSVDLRWDR